MDLLVSLFSQIGLDTSSPLASLWYILSHGGFIFIFWILFRGLADVWLDSRQNIFASKLEWIYLAIDVPKENEQSIKAVEQIFNQISGSMSGGNLIDKWIKGYFQPNFSFEIVSIEGYIQYIIRTPKIFRDLVEAAVYAQYPGAQLTRIEDYTQDITPENFKEQGYDLWGAQFGFWNKNPYPIKTYPMFEHTAAKTNVDPLAAILEIFARMGPGEQAWFQIIAKPISESWKEESKKEVQRIIGAPAKKEEPKGIDKLLDTPSSFASKIGDTYFIKAGSDGDEKKQDMPSKMLYLSPGERQLVELIENKASKTGFETKIRYIYFAKGTKLMKTKAVSGLVGALKQYALLDSNGFIPLPGTKTAVDYFRVKQRVYKLQQKIIKNYKARSSGSGVKGFIMNTEELATIYHFPNKDILISAVSSVEAKKGEAPFSLPTTQPEDYDPIANARQKNQSTQNQNKITQNSIEENNSQENLDGAPPANLPI